MERTHTLIAIALGSVIALPALAVDPYEKPDDAWISISGTAVAPDDDSFTLDYGDGVITVEMDDWDTYGDAYGLMDGDKVTVYGRIDDDLYEVAKLEAGSVYVENLNTYFYASSADEEDPVYWTVTTPVVVSSAVVRGTVKDVQPVEDEFVIQTAGLELTVELEHLGYDPLDDFGFQKIEEGDRVSVSGVFDHDFLEGYVFDATSVITLSDADMKKKKRR